MPKGNLTGCICLDEEYVAFRRFFVERDAVNIFSAIRSSCLEA